MKFNELGRSMVEMLGVLAIIGVLSVGAIAGYSKAMMKYKLNKQAEQIGSVLDYISIYSEQLSIVGNQVTSLNQLLIKLGVIPTEMINPDNLSYVYDVFGNRIHFFRGKESNGAQYYTMAIIIDKYSHEICMNLYQMAKLRSANLWQTVFTKDQESGENSSGNRIFGDSYCTKNVKCLQNLDLSQMDELCNFCNDANSICRFNILWDYKKG